MKDAFRGVSNRQCTENNHLRQSVGNAEEKIKGLSATCRDQTIPDRYFLMLIFQTQTTPVCSDSLCLETCVLGENANYYL